MALVIEDGSNVSGAESYITSTEAKAYATNFGETTFAALDDAEVEIALRKANRYIEAQGQKFQGQKVYADQALMFPRSGVVIDDINVIQNDEIPEILKEAQYELALIASASDIQPTVSASSPRRVTKERIEGAMSAEYSDKGGVSRYDTYTKAECLLKRLYKNTGWNIIRG